MDKDWTFLMGTARSCARRTGMPPDSIEDCVGEFALKMLRKYGGKEADALASLCRNSPALLHKCASDFVCDYCRALTRRRRHEEGWPQIALQEGGTIAWDCVDTSANVDAALCREAFWNEAGMALGRLTPLQCTIFCQHYIEERPLTAIAHDMGKTPYAIGQTLYRARMPPAYSLERRAVNSVERSVRHQNNSPSHPMLDVRGSLRSGQTSAKLPSVSYFGILAFVKPIPLDIKPVLGFMYERKREKRLTPSALWYGPPVSSTWSKSAM